MILTAPEFPNETHLKIHEGCGGRVTWGVDPILSNRFTGHCSECGASRLPLEVITPIELPGDLTAAELYRELNTDAIRQWEWADDLQYKDGQNEIRRLFFPDKFDEEQQTLHGFTRGD